MTDTYSVVLKDPQGVIVQVRATGLRKPVADTMKTMVSRSGSRANNPNRWVVEPDARA